MDIELLDDLQLCVARANMWSEKAMLIDQYKNQPLVRAGKRPDYFAMENVQRGLVALSLQDESDDGYTLDF